MASGRLIDYLGIGLASSRPVSLNLYSGALGLYYATDTSQFSCWNGSAWVTPTVAASAAWGAITGTLSNQTDLFNSLGFSGINAQTASYSAVLTDQNKIITINSSSATTLTITKQATIAWPNNCTLFVCQLGAGLVTVSGDGTALVNSFSGFTCKGQYGFRSIIRVSSDNWIMP